MLDAGSHLARAENLPVVQWHQPAKAVLSLPCLVVNEFSVKKAFGYGTCSFPPLSFFLLFLLHLTELEVT